MTFNGLSGTDIEIAAGLLSFARDEIEREFVAVRGLASSRSQTGEPYVVIGIYGLQKEGLGSPLYDGAANIAIGHWKDHILSYAKGRGKTLYWRIEPEITCINGRWRIYSRLLVSDKRAIDSNHQIEDAICVATSDAA